MKARLFQVGVLMACGVVVLLLVSKAYTCNGCSSGGSAPPAPARAPGGERYGQGVVSMALPPAPYNGQKRCPVSGDLLGSRGPAVQVETLPAPAEKPSFLRRLFSWSAPAQPKGMTIWVCCEECAAHVRSNPGAYLARVIVDRGAGR